MTFNTQQYLSTVQTLVQKEVAQKKDYDWIDLEEQWSLGGSLDVDKFIKQCQKTSSKNWLELLPEWINFSLHRTLRWTEVFNRLNVSEQVKVHEAFIKGCEKVGGLEEWGALLDRYQKDHGFTETGRTIMYFLSWLNEVNDPSSQPVRVLLQTLAQERGLFWSTSLYELDPVCHSTLQACWSPAQAIGGRLKFDQNAEAFLSPATVLDLKKTDSKGSIGEDPFFKYAKWVRLGENPEHMEAFLRYHLFSGKSFGETLLCSAKMVEALQQDPSLGTEEKKKIMDDYERLLPSLTQEFALVLLKKPALKKWIENHFDISTERALGEWKDSMVGVLSRLSWWTQQIHKNMAFDTHRKLFSFEKSSAPERLIDVLCAWYLWNNNKKIGAFLALHKWTKHPFEPSQTPIIEEKGRGLVHKQGREMPKSMHWFEEYAPMFMKPNGQDVAWKWGNDWDANVHVHAHDVPVKDTVLTLLAHPESEKWLSTPFASKLTLKDWLATHSSNEKIDRWIAQYRQAQLENSLSSVAEGLTGQGDDPPSSPSKRTRSARL